MRESPAPLLIWAIVALFCTVVLVAEVALLARVARSVPKNRPLKWLAIGSVAIAVSSVSPATWSFNAYERFNILGGCRGAPPGVCADFYEQIAQAVTIFTSLGWAMVALTVAVLVACAVLLASARRAR
jgi:hypothetical protein